LQYHWKIIPFNAGTITNIGHIATLNLDSTFSGNLKVVCYASNFCNVSNLSDTLYLQINEAPIIYSIIDQTNSIAVNLSHQDNFNWYLNSSLLSFNNMQTINCIGDGTYTVIANNAGCSDTLSNFISCVVSHLPENITSDHISLNPNPTHGLVKVISKNNQIKNIFVQDITGKLIKQFQINAHLFELDLSDLNNGCYFINIVTNDGTTNKKLIIE
jgi:hypothetical protein